MPNPRLMTMPSWNSRATRRAIVCSSSRAFISGSFPGHHAVDIDAGGDDYFGVKSAERYQLVHLGDGNSGGARLDRAEVAPRPLVDQIAVAVGPVSAHQGEVG